MQCRGSGGAELCNVASERELETLSYCVINAVELQ